MLTNIIKKLGVVAVFIICANTHLTAADNAQLVVTATRAAENTITLDTASINKTIDLAIFNGDGTGEELLGTVVITGTKQTADEFGCTITQTAFSTYPAVGGNNPTATEWALFRAGVSANFMILRLDSNVNPTETTTWTAAGGPYTIDKTAVATTAANLTAKTTGTYIAQAISLQFIGVDSAGIDKEPGDYVGNFTIAIGAEIT